MEQSVQSAYSRDGTVRIDKDNVPQTKSVHTIPVFFFFFFFFFFCMDFFGIGPWTMDQKKYMEFMDIMEMNRSIALLLNLKNQRIK